MLPCHYNHFILLLCLLLLHLLYLCYCAFGAYPRASFHHMPAARGGGRCRAGGWLVSNELPCARCATLPGRTYGFFSAPLPAPLLLPFAAASRFVRRGDGTNCGRTIASSLGATERCAGGTVAHLPVKGITLVRNGSEEA